MSRRHEGARTMKFGNFLADGRMDIHVCTEPITLPIVCTRAATFAED